MNKRVAAVIWGILLIISAVYPVGASEMPNYKVAFYAFDCYHMQDENGKRTGYGYEMMKDTAAAPRAISAVAGLNTHSVTNTTRKFR